MMIFLFIGYGFLGLILPTTAVLSLENHGAIAGTASALMGALQFVVGAAVMAVSGIFANGAPKPMMIGIALSALIAFAIARVTLPAENGRLPAATPEES
jgi:MFS transporter, DHA1 family, multidrug resistance protein